MLSKELLSPLRAQRERCADEMVEALKDLSVQISPKGLRYLRRCVLATETKPKEEVAGEHLGRLGATTPPEESELTRT